jgi:hypothetical protein
VRRLTELDEWKEVYAFHAAEIERLRLGLVGITDPTVTDIGELKNMARELLGWPAVQQITEGK